MGQHSIEAYGAAAMVCWRYKLQGGKKASEKAWTKAPYQPNGSPASSTNIATWSAFKHVQAAYAAPPHGHDPFDGIGFVLKKGGGLVAFDFDHCLDPVTGKIIDPAVAEHIRVLDSYSEISPSGTGLHVLAFGSLPSNGRRLGHAEMYQDGRYLTITGRHFPGTPRTIGHRQKEIRTVHGKVFAERAAKHQAKSHTAGGPPISASDEEQLALARRSKKYGAKFAMLYDRGDWQPAGYRSWSEADLALCVMLRFWLGADAARIDAAFRRSGLYRAKWDRQDYSERTIKRALPGKVYGSAAGHGELRLQIKLAMDRLPASPWPGRTGPSNLHLAEALHRIAYRVGSLEFSASYRQLAEEAGLTTPTAWKAAQYLIKVERVTLLNPGSRHTAQWRLTLRPAIDATYNNRAHQEEEASVSMYCVNLRTPEHGIWNPRAVGKGCRHICMMLLQAKEGLSVSQLAKQLSLTPRTVTGRLRKLERYGLAQCSDQSLWHLVERDLDELAEQLGTAGTAARRKLQHELSGTRIGKRALITQTMSSPKCDGGSKNSDVYIRQLCAKSPMSAAHIPVESLR